MLAYLSASAIILQICAKLKALEKWDVQIYIIQYMKAENSPHVFFQIIATELGMSSMTLLREGPSQLVTGFLWTLPHAPFSFLC